VRVLKEAKKKIDTRKIIYRKLREPKTCKKNVAKMTTLAVLVVSLAFVVPGICMGSDVPVNADPEFPDSQDTYSPEPSAETTSWPQKNCQTLLDYQVSQQALTTCKQKAISAFCLFICFL